MTTGRYLDQRHARCPSCHGLVQIPHRRRTLTLDQVMATHLTTCPGHGIDRTRTD